MDVRAVALRARRAFADLLVALFVVLTRGTVRAAVLRARMALRASSSTWLSRGWCCALRLLPVPANVFLLQMRFSVEMIGCGLCTERIVRRRYLY